MAVQYDSTVTIGPEFFVKAFNDYRNKFWAFAREILQNSIDCHSTAIEIRVVYLKQRDETHVIVSNNGAPMTREILVDKLLALGSSGKDFQGAVGGFGKAKEILYFAHKRYKIASADLRLMGSGANYTLVDGCPHVAGTRSMVVWEGDFAQELCDRFRRFVALCDRRNVAFTLNGEEIKPEIPRFRMLRPLVNEGGDEWAHLGMHRSFEAGLMVVRIGGIPMFIESCDFKSTLVLELQGTSAERLTANRDQLRHPFSTRLRDLITQIAVDRRSALTLEKPVYTRFGGPKLGGDAKEGEAAPGTPTLVAARALPRSQDPGGGIAVEVEGRHERATSLLPFQFVIKNCVARKVPREFDPLDVNFSDHAYWLVKAWSGCLLELHKLHGSDHRFSVGFLFSEDAEAEYEWSREYGKVYFLNPAIVTRKSIRRRFKKSEKGRIASIAAHEFVHGGLDMSYHGEDYANFLTEVAGKMFDNWRRFAPHLK